MAERWRRDLGHWWIASVPSPHLAWRSVSLTLIVGRRQITVGRAHDREQEDRA